GASQHEANALKGVPMTLILEPEQYPKFMRTVDNLTRIANKIVASVAAVMLVVMIVQVFADVGLRNMLNSPLPATLEIVSFWWMVALSFLGLAYAKNRNEHIAVSLVSD